MIFVLDRGRIVEHGRHEQLLARDGLYAQLYREQFASADGADRQGGATGEPADGIASSSRR